MKSIVARPCQLRPVVSVADNHFLSVSAVSVTVTVWTLVAISMERYFAICRPLQSRQWQTRFHAYKVIAYVWMAALALNSPILIMSRLQATRDKGNYCNRFCTQLSRAFVCERPAITRPAEVFFCHSCWFCLPFFVVRGRSEKTVQVARATLRWILINT